MAWASLITSTTLALTGSLQTVQLSAADMELELLSFEEAHIQFDFNPQGTPTEYCEVLIQTAPQDIAGSPTFDTDNVSFQRIVIENSVDPGLKSIVLRGIRTFRFRAQLIDTDGTAGGTDTGDLTVRIRRNAVDAAA